MKIALLGYGKEGQAAETYFKKQNAEITIFDKFTDEEIAQKDFSEFDLIFRSPSAKPREGWSSMTKYFFEHCPCPIIGVTGTKGKGTTCSLIAAILTEIMGKNKVHLVGNIGIPAITVLDDLKPDDAVVFEMSSFQLWDMEQSPKIAVVTMIEPDHLNVHDGYDDYINAKMNIARFQDENDYILYYGSNTESKRIAEISKAKKMPYSANDIPEDILENLYIIGEHNRNNAAGAIMAAASYFNMESSAFINKYREEIKKGLASFHGLPHRLEFLRELNNVKYFDDNFSTNVASTRVAVEALKNNNVVMIVGGRDKTNNEDLPELYKIISAEHIKKIVLMGESGHELAKRYNDERFMVVESLDEAISTAKNEAEKLNNAAVLMSPSAASFDMFKDVYDRGSQFAEKIKNLA